MSPTAKILLGAGAVGGAGYLLWRLWPREVTVVVTVPGFDAIPDIPVQMPVTPTYIPPAITARVPPACPPGTLFNSKVGDCVPYQID